MPYSKIEELPAAVKDNLPTHAQEIYMAAWNAAFKEYKDEGKASKVAWAAVGTKYEKDKDGKWVAKKEEKQVDEEEMEKAGGLEDEIEEKAVSEEKMKEAGGGDCSEKKSDEVDMVRSLTHNSTVADSEPAWGDVDKTKLPRQAFARQGEPDKKSTWGYPHHWVSGGKVGDEGVYTSGTMYLHKGGLNAAWAAANGAHTGKDADSGVKAHLEAHRKALGLDKKEEKKSLENYEVRETIKTYKYFRSLPLAPGDIDKENRRVNLTFSSETPVPRDFGNEVLDHNPSSVRLDRIRAGGALLVDHDSKDLVGKIESIQIGSDRKGHATVRFGKSNRAEEIWGDVKDGIRTNVSVGYQIHDIIPEENGADGSKTARVSDWEPLELSLVAIPADTNVGVGRSEDKCFMTRVLQPISKIQKQVVEIDDKKEVIKMELDREQTIKEERERADAITTIGDKHGMKELSAEYIKTGKTVDEFRMAVLEKLGTIKPINTQSSPLIGLTDREAGNFSFVRAINACVNGNWKGAEFEKDASEAHMKRFGKNPRTELGTGFYVPQDILQKRTATDLYKSGATHGGDVVAEILQPQMFIEYLYNKMLTRALGIQILSGLVADIDIPKQTGKSSAYWVVENTAVTNSSPTFGQIKLTPKTVGAFTDISRKLLIQASIDIEAFVRNDLAVSMAIELDRVCLNGKVASGEPLGIMQWPSIGSVSAATNVPTFANIIALESAVAIANALLGNCAYITDPGMKGVLKTVPKVAASTYPVFVWENDEMNGYKAYATNQMPTDLGDTTDHGIIFGNWNDFILAQWAGMFVLVDPYTLGTQGSVRIIVLQDVDTCVRHAGSFAAIQDADLA
ncbi:MAG: phage major capsid protein [Thermodesulfobacteriota bacterium]